jgi:lipid-A-disaccharide synthase
MIVAGEASGDTLGAGLIRNLRHHFPDCQFSGIGGEKMIAEGFVSHFKMDRLSIMGFVEPLKRLPELLGMIRDLKARMRDEKPDIFIGIDSPDFNMRLEPAAKKLGIFSAHYVSPSVWAWRQGRVKKIKKSIDLMLTFLPFEADFYRKHQVPVEYVGHPLADELPLDPNQTEARQTLSIRQNGPVCALMPGSRRSEVEFLLPIMLKAAEQLKAIFPHIEFILPAANSDRRAEIEAQFTAPMSEYIHLIDGDSHTAMTAADCIVMASGTTTLEAMLLKRPMVIVYKWPNITWKILSRLVKVPWVGLPNLICNEQVAPELLQDKATVENVVAELKPLLDSDATQKAIASRFLEHHLDMRKGASAAAAQAIYDYWSAAR